jgi:hypothetical protein
MLKIIACLVIFSTCFMLSCAAKQCEKAPSVLDSCIKDLFECRSNFSTLTEDCALENVLLWDLEMCPGYREFLKTCQEE